MSQMKFLEALRISLNPTCFQSLARTEEEGRLTEEEVDMIKSRLSLKMRVCSLQNGRHSLCFSAKYETQSHFSYMALT